MPRVKRGVQAHAKHKKVLKAAKGFAGLRLEKKKSVYLRSTFADRLNPVEYVTGQAPVGDLV